MEQSIEVRPAKFGFRWVHAGYCKSRRYSDPNFCVF